MQLPPPPGVGSPTGFGKQRTEMPPSLDRLMTGSSHIHVDPKVSPLAPTHSPGPMPTPATHYAPCHRPAHAAYYSTARLEPGYPYPSPASSLSSSLASSPPSANVGLPPVTFAMAMGRHVMPQSSLLPPPAPQYGAEPQYQFHRKRPAALADDDERLAAAAGPARKRSRHAWPAEATRDIINVLLNEFLGDPGFRTTIYRSRDERDHRFARTDRTVLEEYNKVQNMRRRYFIPLSYLLQWDQLRSADNMRFRQRAAIEKKLSKPLECSRLQQIFSAATAAAPHPSPVDDQEPDTDASGRQVFEIHIFVAELTRRDPRLWARGVTAFQAWMARYHRGSIDYIINH
ncbi:hypothetical protein H4R19_000351 [Coemansia spiralis]|nr:hypothetical protein H4R19_000351 [Coemansia spiralis]